MEKSDLQFFRDWFRDYTSGFHSRDRDMEWLIQIKIGHSYRVGENTKEIGNELGIGKNDLLLAETIGLFHDIGRFEQSVRYGTLHDDRSENHAILGVKVLEKESVLSNLDKKEGEIILTAIRLHNAKALPDIQDDKTLFYSRLIRDADKLDILRVVTDYYERRRQKRNPLIELELEDGPGYSTSLVQDILEDRISDSGELRTLNDLKLLQLSWIFDINFLPTLKRVCEKRYLERILKGLPDNSEIREVDSHIRSYIERRFIEGA
ncbi:MAG: HD domain-containing protein [Thermoplasmata archaeon]|nr:HD domain-containing protein [Thermoplasmata archaeon]